MVYEISSPIYCNWAVIHHLPLNNRLGPFFIAHFSSDPQATSPTNLLKKKHHVSYDSIVKTQQKQNRPKDLYTKKT